MKIGSVEISGIKYPPKIIYKKNQCIGISAAGSVKVSSFFEEIFIVLKIEKENLATAQALRAFIRNTANYSANPLIIYPDSNIDLGNGLGNSITVRFWSDNLNYVCNTGNLFDFEFMFRKEVS